VVIVWEGTKVPGGHPPIDHMTTDLSILVFANTQFRCALTSQDLIIHNQPFCLTSTKILIVYSDVTVHSNPSKDLLLSTHVTPF